jgi:hypothetical protein
MIEADNNYINKFSILFLNMNTNKFISHTWQFKYYFETSIMLRFYFYSLSSFILSNS